MRFPLHAIALAFALTPLAALAHGPQLQITLQHNTSQNDQLITRQIFREEPYTVLSAPKRVYVIPLIEVQGVWYSQPNSVPSDTAPELPEYISGPGIAYGYDQVDGGPRDFASGYRFELKLIDGLQIWDGSAFGDPGDEQIEAYRSSESAVTNDGLTPLSPAMMPFGNVPSSSLYGPTAHSGASFRMLGDGLSSTVEGEDGVYLLSMQYASTEPGIDASLPFYFLLHKNAAPAEISGAVTGLLTRSGIDSSFVQYVPEPSSITFTVLGIVAGIARRQSRNAG